MIKDVDILYSFASMLKTNFKYKVYAKENEEEVKEPTFFITLFPLTSNSFLRYNEKLINIAITYTDKVVDQEILLNMQNSLDELFDLYIEVNKRKLIFDKKKFNKTNDFITLTLTLNYLDDKSTIPDNEKFTKLMGELNGNIN